jgi:hypothetical protein
MWILNIYLYYCIYYSINFNFYNHFSFEMWQKWKKISDKYIYIFYLELIKLYIILSYSYLAKALQKKAINTYL